ncbi:MAG: electron transfer flavoprotein subunit alpha/FixB family protein [Syntrophomonadaceae bacterium]|jgi:electron transfer flavoprotein alpha subunit
MPGVWILAENRDQTLELLNIGRNLADAMNTGLTAFLSGDRNLAQDYIDYGADEVLILPDLPQDQMLDAYIPIIVDETRKGDPDLFLISATLRGKDVAARVAARLDVGLCSQCTGLSLDPQTGLVNMERLVYGGAAIQKVVCRKRPQMATIAPRVFDPVTVREARDGKIRELPAPPPAAVHLVNKKAKDRTSGSLTEAKIVICAGRGIEKQEDLELVNQLAEIVGGEIGCTRPLSEEMHWLPEDTCIGLSGKEIKPDLYLGLGVSGQIQHITGIKDSRIICAVNSDENAPIFEVANYGIVGNLYEVVPELNRQLDQVINKK